MVQDTAICAKGYMPLSRNAPSAYARDGLPVEKVVPRRLRCRAAARSAPRERTATPQPATARERRHRNRIQGAAMIYEREREEEKARCAIYMRKRYRVPPRAARVTRIQRCQDIEVFLPVITHANIIIDTTQRLARERVVDKALTTPAAQRPPPW